MKNIKYIVYVLIVCSLSIFGAANDLDLAKVPFFKLEDSDLEQIVNIGNEAKDHLYNPQFLQQCTKNLMSIPAAYNVMFFLTLYMRYQDPRCAESMLKKIIPVDKDPVL